METLPSFLPAGMSFGASFFFSLLFGMIGTGYFMYGKKEQKYICMSVGVALGVYPFFISNAVAVLLIGIVLMALPFYVQE